MLEEQVSFLGFTCCQNPFNRININCIFAISSKFNSILLYSQPCDNKNPKINVDHVILNDIFQALALYFEIHLSHFRGKSFLKSPSLHDCLMDFLDSLLFEIATFFLLFVAGTVKLETISMKD